MRLFVALLVAATLAAPGLASTPAATKQGRSDAKAACRKASGLKNAASLGAPLLFNDTAGETAVPVTGIWRPAHMKGARATMLCLYDRAARSAEVTEAKGWAAK